MNWTAVLEEVEFELGVWAGGLGFGVWAGGLGKMELNLRPHSCAAVSSSRQRIKWLYRGVGRMCVPTR